MIEPVHQRLLSSFKAMRSGIAGNLPEPVEHDDSTRQLNTTGKTVFNNLVNEARAQLDDFPFQPIENLRHWVSFTEILGVLDAIIAYLETSLRADSEHEDKYDIFLSYTAGDSMLAEELREEFVRAHLNCFMAEKDLRVGSDWNEGIREALRRSRIVMLLLTTRSSGRPWILLEAGAAWALGKDVLPVLNQIDPESIPAPVNRYHAKRVETSKERMALVRELTGT